MNNGPNDPPSQAEWGLLRARLAKLGFSQKDINNSIGTVVNGRSRLIISNSLKTWLRTRL